MPGVKIKVGAVVAFGMEWDPRFGELYERMKTDFGNEEYVRRVCLHEAAHAQLMEEDGHKNVRVMGPDIIYNPPIDKFLASSARVVADDQPDAVLDDDYIFKSATQIAAGGVALEMAGYTDKGDG